MSGKSTKRSSRKLSKADWAFLRRRDDRGIDYSDIPPMSEETLRTATLVLPPRKVRITTNVDADVLAWLKRGGSRYQTRINAILREVMRASQDTRGPASRKRRAA